MGDTIERITEATGIKKVVKWAFGEDCGCDGRKITLNKLFPYRTPECLNQEEHDFLSVWFSKPRHQATYAEQTRLIAINNRIFHEKRKPCANCGKSFMQMLDKLKKVFDTYEENDN